MTDSTENYYISALHGDPSRFVFLDLINVCEAPTMAERIALARYALCYYLFN